jgi:UDP-2,3-diacylglucosamine pyrophosphatase LpxH
MKKPFYFWLAAFSALLVMAFMAWAFARHGTSGLFTVNGTYKGVFIAVGVIALAAPLLALPVAGLKERGKALAATALTVAVLGLSLPGLLATPAAFTVLSGITQTNIGDTPPQLFISEQTGAYGLPDLAVTFNTAEATTATLTWGQSGGQSRTASEPSAVTEHVFMLGDLEPATAYWYRLEGDETHYFQTAPLDGTLHFAVGSDAHYGASTRDDDAAEDILGQIADPSFGFDYFFLTGDLVEWGFELPQWQEAFRSLSQATSSVPFLMAVGNHDTLFAGFDYFQRYARPDGMPDESGSKLWSRIDVGNIHFLVLDVEWSAEAFTDEQAAWLKEELASIPDDDWKIVLEHGFTYSSGADSDSWAWYDDPATIAKLTPIFEEYGVDLVCSGHNHHMELLQKSGVTYAICGAFAGHPDSERTYTSPYSLWYEHGEHGFMDITIDGDEATIVFRAPDYSQIYSYTLSHS